MSGKRNAKKVVKTSTRDLLQNWNEFYINSEFGIGVQCIECQKWRLTYEYQESREVPEDWTCSMLKLGKKKRGNCGMPSDLTEADFAAEDYPPGTVVWAKLTGHPWWPGMIEDNPDNQEFFIAGANGGDYHVHFFGEKTLRSWVKASFVREFDKRPAVSPSDKKRVKRSTSLKKAIEQAEEALKISIKERLKMYSFVRRFQGRWGKIRSKDEVSLPPTCPEVKGLAKPIESTSSATNGARERKWTDSSEDEVQVKREPPACRNEVCVKREDEEDQQSAVTSHSVESNSEGNMIQSIDSADGNEEAKPEGDAASVVEGDTCDSAEEVVSPIVVTLSDSEDEVTSPEQLAYQEFLNKKFPSFIQDPNAW